MPSEEGWSNLIPIKSGEEARNRGRNGGLVKSEKKTFSAQLREIKKRVKKGQLSTNDEEWFLTRLTNAEMSSADLMSSVDKIQESVKDIEDPDLKLRITNMKKEIHKTIHGQKIKSENVNVNINVDAETEEVYRLIKGRQ
jgi:hypothetical protein